MEMKILMLMILIEISFLILMNFSRKKEYNWIFLAISLVIMFYGRGLVRTISIEEDVLWGLLQTFNVFTVVNILLLLINLYLYKIKRVSKN